MEPSSASNFSVRRSLSSHGNMLATHHACTSMHGHPPTKQTHATACSFRARRLCMNSCGYFSVYSALPQKEKQPHCLLPSVFQVMVGYLVPLTTNLEEDGNGSMVPVFQGNNVVGRSIVSVPDKRVSRKHVSFNALPDGPVEVMVVWNLFFHPVGLSLN